MSLLLATPPGAVGRPVRVDATLFAIATRSLAAANQAACAACGRLEAGLADSAAMAGTDSSGARFASSYDTAATSLATALQALPPALAALTRGVWSTGRHHLSAEHAALATPGPLDLDTLLPAPDLTELTTCWTPPSALGGQDDGMPTWAHWVLSHIGGFVWPNADTDALRTAATAWTETATTLEPGQAHTDRADSMLALEATPEITRAREHLAGLHHAATGLTHDLGVISRACTAYADAVDDHRHQILDLIADLERDALLIEGAGLLLDLVSGPAGTAGATELLLARIAAKAPAVLAVLENLAALTTTITATLDAAATTDRGLDTALLALSDLGDASAPSDSSYSAIPGWSTGEFLDYFESLEDGHTKRDHVGLTDDQLIERQARTGNDTVSTFTDRTTAEQAIRRTLEGRQNDIASWMTSRSKTEGFEVAMGSPIGRVLTGDGTIEPARTARVVLRKDPTLAWGWRILTAYAKR